MYLERRQRARALAALMVVGVPVLASCGSSGSTPSVAVLKLPVPVHAPVWNDDNGVIFALTDDTSQVARIKPEKVGAKTTLSARLGDVGENLATSPTVDDAVYLPQPKLGRIAVFGDPDMRQLGTFQAGPAPSWVVPDVGSNAVIALSEDGSTATPVTLTDLETLPSQHVDAGPEGELDGPDRGRLIDYFVTNHQRIAHYKGDYHTITERDTIGIGVHTSAGDPTKITRLYVGEEGTDRLLAIDVNANHDHLVVSAAADVGEQIEYVGADTTRVYAVTKDKIFVFQSNSFEGYRDKKFIPVATIDLRASLPSEGKSATPSGFAVGHDRVYLTLKDQPYALSIAKPDL